VQPPVQHSLLEKSTYGQALASDSNDSNNNEKHAWNFSAYQEFSTTGLSYVKN
jgi:hypothetical protein